jgi:UDP-N-acetylmuramate--alanine ligase
LVLAFQPHRFSRTRDCFEDFVAVLQKVDVLWLTEVYSAGEVPIAAADGRSLSHAVRVAGQQQLVFAQDLKALADLVVTNALDGDVVMCMGAGSIGSVPSMVVERCANRAALKVVSA